MLIIAFEFQIIFHRGEQELAALRSLRFGYKKKKKKFTDFIVKALTDQYNYDF